MPVAARWSPGAQIEGAARRRTADIVRMLGPRLSCILAATILASHPAFAQQREVSDSMPGGRNGTSSGEIWLGYSQGSTSAGFLGGHGGITLGLLGMRFNQRVRPSEPGFLYYTFDLIPVARVTPIIEYTGQAANKCAPPKYDCLRTHTTARGVGISPLGWTVVYHRERRVQWRLGGNGGVMIFDKPAPSDLASRFNFTAAIEGGVQVVNPSGTGLLIVYRLHHLSNGGRAEDNLAILSHIFSIGARWRLSR